MTLMVRYGRTIPPLLKKKEVIIVSKDDIVALRADVLSNPTMEGIALLERALNASRWEGVTDINHVLDVRDR